MKFEKPVLSGMFGRLPGEVIKLYSKNEEKTSETKSSNGQLSCESSNVNEIINDWQFNDHGQFSDNDQINDHGQDSDNDKINDHGQVSYNHQINYHGQFSDKHQINDNGQFSDNHQINDHGHFSDNVQINHSSYTHSREELLSMFIAERLSQLQPVPPSQIPASMTKNRNPLLSLPHITDKCKDKNVKKIRKNKTDSKLPKSNSMKSKNQTLREEQASIASKFRENIAVHENTNGIKMYQCQLCEESSFQSILIQDYFLCVFFQFSNFFSF